MENIQIRALSVTDAKAFQALRLMAIENSPTSILPTYAEEAARSIEEIELRICTTDWQIVFGAFVMTECGIQELVGILGLKRESLLQVNHKGLIWGVFVNPNQRGQGLARKLIAAAIEHAKTCWHLCQINLSANVISTAATNLYTSMGFVTYGIEPMATRIGTQYYDEQWMHLPLS
jgi:GNAT superfamily N-acetyltransferase